MSDNTSPSGSGEYSALLLAAIKEIRDDQREFRIRMESRMDTQGGKIEQVLISLADGKGRMDVMQQNIEGLDTAIGIHDRRIKSIESGSGLRSVITAAIPQSPAEPDRPTGGWISADKLPAIIAAIGSVVATILASVALMKQPAAPAVPAPSAATSTP